MRIETDYKIRIKPKHVTHYVLGPCGHKRYDQSWTYSHCAACVGAIGTEERDGYAVRETDQLTYSMLVGVYIQEGNRRLFMSAELFEVIE